MPYESEKQRKWMWANRPDIAEKWEREGHGYVKGKKRKERKKK